MFFRWTKSAMFRSQIKEPEQMLGFSKFSSPLIEYIDDHKYPKSPKICPLFFFFNAWFLELYLQSLKLKL